MKQTEVGLIPDDWDTVKLSDIATFRRGTFPQPYGLPQWYGGPENYPFVQVADLSDNKFCLNETTNQTISKLAQERSLFVPKGSVIVTLQGTIGRVAITQYDCYMDRTLAVFESFKREINKEYFALALHDKFQIEAKQAPGGIIKTITKEVFSDFNIILPPLNEQKKIAEALSNIDSLICNIEEEIEKKKNIKNGAMQELLTGKRRLPGFAKSDKNKMTELGEFPEDWEIKEVKDLAEEMVDGPFGSNLKKEHYTEDKEVRIIQLSNVGENGWTDENTKYTTFEHAKTISRCIIPNTETILVAKMMPAGRAIICPKKERQYILGSDVIRIQANKNLFPKYFVFASKSEWYKKQIADNTQGSTRQRTSITKLKYINIVLPEFNEQKAIAEFLSDMDEEINELETKLSKYKKIKDGMMQQLLTGKIRLH